MKQFSYHIVTSGSKDSAVDLKEFANRLQKSGEKGFRVVACFGDDHATIIMEKEDETV